MPPVPHRFRGSVGDKRSRLTRLEVFFSPFTDLGEAGDGRKGGRSGTAGVVLGVGMKPVLEAFVPDEQTRLGLRVLVHRPGGRKEDVRGPLEVPETPDRTGSAPVHRTKKVSPSRVPRHRPKRERECNNFRDLRTPRTGRDGEQNFPRSVSRPFVNRLFISRPWSSSVTSHTAIIYVLGPRPRERRFPTQWRPLVVAAWTVSGSCLPRP